MPHIGATLGPGSPPTFDAPPRGDIPIEVFPIVDPVFALADTSLAATAATDVGPDASSGASSSLLTLTAATRVPLDSVSATSIGAASLTDQALIVLSSTAGSSATLAPSATTRLPLGASSGVSAPSLSASAKALIAATSSASASGTLALKAASTVVCGASATASATLAVTARTMLAGASSGVASATLSVGNNTGTAIPCAASSGASSSSLALHAPVLVGLVAANGQTLTTLQLSKVISLAADSQSDARLSLNAPCSLVFASTGESSATSSFHVPTGMPLDSAHAAAVAILKIRARGGAYFEAPAGWQGEGLTGTPVTSAIDFND